MVSKIYMDPQCRMNYASFYIHGLREMFGRNAVFRAANFSALPPRKQSFIFIIDACNSHTKVAVDFHDSRDLELDILEWSDIYAKINLHDTSYLSLDNYTEGERSVLKSKIVNIPPSFGIRVFGFSQTALHLVFLCYHYLFKSNFLDLVKDTIRMYLKRLPISHYMPGKRRNGYVFFIASVWHQSTDYINLTRAHFIRACKRIKNLTFEGGFVDIGYECTYIGDLPELMFESKKIPLKEFIKKTTWSSVVFNNPSVAFCHGWKLAEYLALGKAIISVPLSNELPVGFIHCKEIYFVENNEQSMGEAICYLLSNPNVINGLENNAQTYWLENASPTAVIKSLLTIQKSKIVA